MSGFLLLTDDDLLFTERKCRVLTTEGELLWDAIQQNVTWKAINEELSSYEYDDERDYMYRTQLEVFIDCVENKNNPIVTVKDGINVIKLIDAARDASINNSKTFL